MTSVKPRYIWQVAGWPAFSFDLAAAAPALAAARRAQGQVEGKARALGLEATGQVAQNMLAQEAIATAGIEGQALDALAVRSSVLRHLGLSDHGPRDRHVDGLVAVVADATSNLGAALDKDRLFRWQSALFPGGTSGIHRIAVGCWRTHADPMQIVSGLPGKEVVHYQAPASKQVPMEMAAFLRWFAATVPQPAAPPAMDGIARAAIAHLWFETIHPFEDGNGRVGRAIADLALAQDHGAPMRLYSLSRQLLAERRSYYDALHQAQHGGLDITAWVSWFARQTAAACERSNAMMDAALEKARFWATNAAKPVTLRQRKVLQRLLDDGDSGFLGGLNADKYMKLTNASKATATRDLSDLVAKELLWTVGQGKAVRYYVNVAGWGHGVAGERAGA